MMMPTRIFVRCAGTILLFVAMMLFLSNLAANDLAQLHDPLLGISLYVLFWVIGGIMAVASVICFFDENQQRGLVWALWVSVNFLGYKAGQFAVNNYHYAKIPMGNLPEAFKLKPQAIDMSANVLFGSLFLASSVFLLWTFWQTKFKRPANKEAGDYVKISCVHCGGHIAFSRVNIGFQTKCPHCSQEITLRPL